MNLTENVSRERQAVIDELNRYRIVPISFEIYKKSDYEKAQLATAKAAHKALFRLHGLSPKKYINVPAEYIK